MRTTLPASSPTIRSSRAWGVRAVVVTSTMALLLTASLGTAASARGVDLTNIINATRRSQLEYEASMLAADRTLKSLAHEQRRTQRTIKKVSTRLSAIKERRAEARARREAAKERYSAALASVTAPTQSDAADAATSLPTPPIPALIPVLPRLIEFQDQIAAGRSAGVVTAPASPVSPEEIRALRATSMRQNHQLRRIERKTRKVQQTLRAKTRKIAKMPQRRQAALGQRASSEAALKSRIYSMAGLALRRASRKTSVRPGRTTAFVWPTRGRISQSYGCTGSTFSPARGSCAHFHDGIDIVAGHASAIRAAGVGVISYVGRNPWDRGKRAFMVVIAHPGGYESLYAHVLPIRRVQVGQVVHKGQLIALMGSTGHSTGTHLHFELRRGRTTVNPLALL